MGSRRSSPSSSGSSSSASRRPSSIAKSSTVSATSTRRCSRKTRVRRVRSPTNWCATSSRTNRCPASSTSRRCRSGSCRKSRSPKSTRWRARGFPRAIASCRSALPNAPAWRCRRRPVWRRSSPPRSKATLSAYVDRVNAQPLLAHAADAGHGRARLDARGHRRHGVAAVERPARHSQADALQGRRDPVPRGQSWRDVARERSGSGRRRERPSRSSPTADWASSRRLDLNRVLAGSSTGVQADIDEVDEGMRGGAARKDVEKMFQLIYLTFTAPRADPAQFEALKARLRPMLANQQARPEAAFRDALVSALTQDHPRARPLTAASVDQMNLDRSMAFYKSRFADASDFTFVFVGSFDVRRDEAAGRALPGQPAVAPSRRGRGRPRRSPAGRRRGTAGRQGRRSAEARWRSSSADRSRTTRCTGC